MSESPIKGVKVGLMVLRGQPLHYGHCRSINQILYECDLVLLAFGSCQEARTDKNPFTFQERVQMGELIYGNSPKIKYVDLYDHPFMTALEWARYVVNQAKAFCPSLPITDFYGGSRTDVEWFFGIHNTQLHVIDRTEHPEHQATFVRESLRNGDCRWKALTPPIIHDFIERCLNDRF